MALLPIPKLQNPLNTDGISLRPLDNLPAKSRWPETTLWYNAETKSLVMGSDPQREVVFKDDLGLDELPVVPSFFPTGDVVIESIGGPQGDPFIVKDDIANLFVMYYFWLQGASGLRQSFKTSKRLAGPWGPSTNVPSLNGAHKFVFLVDLDRNPIMIEGKYHGYASVFINVSDQTKKQITHYTSSSLYGPWNYEGVVISPLINPISYDNYNCDTPCATFVNDVINIFYMANPSTPTGPSGVATVQLRAKSRSPFGPFEKDEVPILVPGLSPTDWDYGWIGGVQITNLSVEGVATKLAMIYNAGGTRPAPSAPGTEPIPGDIGFAFADSIDGPWTKYSYNPVTQYQTTPANYPGTDIYWRGFYTFDDIARSGFLFFNASSPLGGESVSYAIENLQVSRTGTAPNFTAVTVFNQGSPSPLPVPNSRSWLYSPGNYKVKITINFFYNNLTPGGDVTLRIVDQDGVVYGTAVKYLLPSIAFWNDDATVEALVTVKDKPLQIRATVAAGFVLPISSNPNSQVRYVRFTVERVNGSSQ